MSTSWRDIGRNSGNFATNRNITTTNLQSNGIKLNPVFKVSNKIVNGFSFDISGETVVFGIGTNEPFSRLSLGGISGSGEFDKNSPGQLAAIALHEKPDGKEFCGLVYNNKLESYSTDTSRNGIQIIAFGDRDFSMNDVGSGRIYLSDENITTIGGIPRKGIERDDTTTPASYKGIDIGNNPEINSEDGQTKIVLDVRGSIRTDGYINFFSVENNETSPHGNFWDDARNIRNIPKGSLWLKGPGGFNREGLYFKDFYGTIFQVDTTLFGSSASGIEEIPWIAKTTGNDNPYIIQKSFNGVTKGGLTPVTLSGIDVLPEELPGGENEKNIFKNLLTIRAGNLSVCGISGESLEVYTSPGNPISELPEGNASTTTTGIISSDISGGIIWAERQLLVGPHKYNKNWAVIDIETVNKAPALLSYNMQTDNGEVASVCQPNATNSIILLRKKQKHTTDPTSSYGCIIGKDYDCVNSIIIGDAFKSIDTPNSFICSINPGLEDGQEIIDPSGGNIVFGYKNTLKFAPFSFIMGSENEIDLSGNTQTTIQNGGGNILIGKSNLVKNNTDLFNSNITIGQDNELSLSEYGFINGNSNKSWGKANIIFGKSNVIGIDKTNGTSEDLDLYKYYTANNNFIVGQSNKIKAKYTAPENIAPENIIIMGKNNEIDLSNNSYINDTNKSYVLLGSNTMINATDLSDVRFAFGTYEKSINDVSNNGNVFTIDCSGNVRIDGNIDISGVFLSGMNAALHTPPTQHGMLPMWNDITKVWESKKHNPLAVTGHLLDCSGISFDGKLPGSETEQKKYHLYGSNFYVKKTGDISANDASFNTLFVNKDISATNWYIRENGDISGNDASFNTLFVNRAIMSATNWYIKENGDISGNDASFNSLFVNKDISASQWYIREDGDISGNDASFNTLYVNRAITSATNWYIKENGDISGNDASFNTLYVNRAIISATNWYIKENGDISGNDASFNSLFVNKDISASQWYIREDGDISGNDASFNTLFINKDISASNWYIRENGDISGNDASFNKLVITGNILPATNNVTIGSLTNPIKDIYISQNSLHFINGEDPTKSCSISVENELFKFKKDGADIVENYVTNNMDGSTDISCGNIEIFGDLSCNDISFSNIEISGNLVIDNSLNTTYTALFKNDNGPSTLLVQGGKNDGGEQKVGYRLKSNDNHWFIGGDSKNESDNALNFANFSNDAEFNLELNNYTKMIIDTNGNVGIGTIILDASLCVAGDISANSLRCEFIESQTIQQGISIKGDVSFVGTTQTDLSTTPPKVSIGDDDVVAVVYPQAKVLSVQHVTGYTYIEIEDEWSLIVNNQSTFGGHTIVDATFLGDIEGFEGSDGATGKSELTVNATLFFSPNQSYDLVYNPPPPPPALTVHGHVFVNGTITENTCDKRIKNNINDVDNSKALEIIKKIPCKYYNYISKNTGTECGFIAQDVKKHFPIAVTVRKNILIPSEYREINTNFTQVWFNESENTIVPNRIYSGGEITKRKYKIVIEDLSNNSMDSKYRFCLDKNLKRYIELKPIETPKTFLFDSELDYLFVFGKYIDDFHALDKNQIFALHHSGIQELNKIQESKKNKLTGLKTENNILKTEIETLKGQMDNILQRLTNSGI